MPEAFSMISQSELADSIALLKRMSDREPRIAVEMLLDVLEKLGESGDPALLADLYCRLGNCRIVLHDPIGIKDFESALAYAQQCNDQNLIASVLHGLSRLFMIFGDIHSALQYCEQAMDVGRTLSDPKQFAQISMTLGWIFSHAQQFSRSLEIYTETAAICRAQNDQPGLMRVLNNWADALVLQFCYFEERQEACNHQMLDDAIGFARQALSIAEECGILRSQLLIMETLAHAMEQRGVYAEALQELEAGLSKLSGHGFIREELDVQVRLGALQLHLNQAESAVERLLKAREVALQMGSYSDFQTLLKTLSQACEESGDLISALKYYKEFHCEALKILDQRVQINAQIYAVKLDLEKLQKEADAHKTRLIKLENFNRSLSAQVLEDSLTGLPNRRALEAHVKVVMQRKNARISFALIDLDFFKQVNDGYSHLIGDEVLRHFGRLVLTCLRAGDMVARIGGEEFAMLMERSDLNSAKQVCERLRVAVQDYNWSDITQGLQQTASFGITRIRPDDDLQSMMGRADSALYQAKRNGRNRIELA